MSRPEACANTPPDEFDLIDFIRQQAQSGTGAPNGVVVGIGDDCAVLQPPHGQLLVSSDTLNSGVHFFPGDPPASIGHKALAVNLSDLAACGATPRWVSLNLSLPDADRAWLRDFLRGFLNLAQRHKVSLIGGDTTAGALSVSVTVMGFTTRPLLRSGARDGDLLAVSGPIGSAAFALKHRHTTAGWALSQALQYPQPRLDISEAIAPFAHACIDVSDGLLADAEHLCQASGLEARIDLERIPVHPLVKKTEPDWPSLVLGGGDDYQLLFALAEGDRQRLPEGCHIIGQLHRRTGQPAARVYAHGTPFPTRHTGYRHFSAATTTSHPHESPAKA